MKDKTTERRTITIEIDLPPNIVTLAGHNLYIRDCLEKQGTAVQASACKALERFDEAMELFAPKTPDGNYCMILRMLVNTLANGIASKKADCKMEKQAAMDKEAEMLSEISQNERWVGVFIVGLRLLVLGGLGFCVGKLFHIIVSLFGIHAAQSNGTGMDATWMPIATALGFTLLGSCVFSRLKDKNRREIRKECRDAIERATANCDQGIEWEYKLALQRAQEAWENLTGEDSPESVIPEKPQPMSRDSQM